MFFLSSEGQMKARNNQSILQYAQCHYKKEIVQDKITITGSVELEKLDIIMVYLIHGKK